MSRRNRQQTAVLPRLLAVGLALLLASQAVISARNGLSDLYARPAIEYLKQKRYDRLTEDEWQAIEQNVAHAAKMMPSNPAYLEGLGWLHQIKLTEFADALSIEELDAHGRAATDYFLQATASRPTWPYYWGNLALEQYRRGNYGSKEFSLALANVVRFGPWKRDNQILVADLGSETWAFLTPEAQRAVLQNLERGLEGQPDTINTIVDHYRKWPELCAKMETLGDSALRRVSQQCGQLPGDASERSADSG